MYKTPMCWIFTFKSGQEHEGYYVKVRGSFSEARQKMRDKYGESWSIQYSEEEWQHWIESSPAYVPIEKELEVID